MKNNLLQGFHHPKCPHRLKRLCLGVYVAEPEDEKFRIVDTVKFGSERFDFGVYRLGRGVG